MAIHPFPTILIVTIRIVSRLIFYTNNNISQDLFDVRKAIDTEFQKNFGKRIKQLRVDKKYTQEVLADKAGLHWTYLGQIERGERNPTLKNIVKLARALAISMHELFSFDN